MRSKLASSIAILLNYGAKWRLLYYIFYVFCLDYELSILFDKRLLKVRAHHRDILLEEYKDPQIKEKILTQSSNGEIAPFLSKTMGFLNMLSYFSQSNNYLLPLLSFLLILIVLLAITYDMIFIIKNGNDKQVKSRYQNYSIFFFNFEFNAFSIFGFVLKCITCMPDYRQKELTMEALKTSSTGVAHDIGCYSLIHTLMILGTIIALPLLIFLLIVTQNLTVLVDLGCPKAKFGYFDLSHFGCMIFLIAFKQYVLANGYTSPHLYTYFVILSILGFLSQLTFLVFNRNYYSTLFEKATDLRTVILLSGSFILLREEINFWVLQQNLETKNMALYTLAPGIITILFIFKAILAFKYRKISSKIALSKKNINPRNTLFMLSIMEEYIKNWKSEKAESQLAKILFNFWHTNKVFLRNQPELKTKILEALGLACISDNWDQQEVLLLNKGMPKNESANLVHPCKKDFMTSIDQTKKKPIKEILQIMVMVVEFEISKWNSTKLYQAPLALLAYHFRLMIEVQGKIAKAIASVKLMKKAASTDSWLAGVKMEILQQIILNRLRISVKENKVFLPEMRKYIQMDIPPQNHIDFTVPLEYWNHFEIFKVRVSEALDIKSSFVTDLFDKGFDMRQLMNHSNKLRKIDSIIRELMHEISNTYRKQATVFLMMKVFYYLHIAFNIKKAREIIRNLANLKYSELMEQAFENLKNKNQIVTVVASGEQETFHTIYYASSNIESFAGFDPVSLVGKDLLTFIPKPACFLHKSFLTPENNTGLLLEYDTEFVACMKTKSGPIIPACLFVRVNSSITRGLQYLASIKTPTTKYENTPFMLVSSSGEIMEVCTMAAKYFKSGTYLSRYSKNLALAFKNFSKISNSRLQIRMNPSNGLTDNEKVQILMEQKDYLLLSKKLKFRLRTESNQQELFGFKFVDIVVERSQSLFFWVKIYDSNVRPTFGQDLDMFYPEYSISCPTSNLKREESFPRVNFLNSPRPGPMKKFSESSYLEENDAMMTTCLLGPNLAHLKACDILEKYEQKIVGGAFLDIKACICNQSGNSLCSSESQKAKHSRFSKERTVKYKTVYTPDTDKYSEMSDFKTDLIFSELITNHGFSTRIKRFLLSIFLINLVLYLVSFILSFWLFSTNIGIQVTMQKSTDFLDGHLALADEALGLQILLGAGRAVTKNLLPDTAFAEQGIPRISEHLKQLRTASPRTSILQKLNLIQVEAVSLKSQETKLLLPFREDYRLVFYKWISIKSTFNSTSSEENCFQSLQIMGYAQNTLAYFDSLPTMDIFSQDSLENLLEFFSINTSSPVLHMLKSMLKNARSFLEKETFSLVNMLSLQLINKAFLIFFEVTCISLLMLGLYLWARSLAKNCFNFRKDVIIREKEYYSNLKINLETILLDTVFVQKQKRLVDAGKEPLKQTLSHESEGSQDTLKKKCKKKEQIFAPQSKKKESLVAVVNMNSRPKIEKVVVSNKKIRILNVRTLYWLIGLLILQSSLETTFFTIISKDGKILQNNLEAYCLLNRAYMSDLEMGLVFTRLLDYDFPPSVDNQINHVPLLEYSQQMQDEVKADIIPKFTQLKREKLGDTDQLFHETIFEKSLCELAKYKENKNQVWCLKSTINFLTSRAGALKLLTRVYSNNQSDLKRGLENALKEYETLDFFRGLIETKSVFSTVLKNYRLGLQKLFKDTLNPQTSKSFEGNYLKLCLPFLILSMFGICWKVYRVLLVSMLDLLGLFQLFSVNLFKANPWLIKYAKSLRRLRNK